MGKYYYDAFISYRHKELDCFVAESIHKSLERYRIPKRVQQKCGKKRIERVFRDSDELPTSSDLAENIRSALEKSEYLIVVCSPDTPESKWVQQEIELFLETHSRDHILAVLIAGEPEDAFPETLRIVKEEVTGKDGKKTVVQKKVEPLAADIRGASGKEMKKKLKTEILRLLAPMLSCSYDDLRQRHREYTMKKTVFAVGIIACLALAFTGYTLYQSAKVQEQYQKALKEESRYLAEVSGNLLKSGDRMGALQKALEALPEEDGEERPLVQDAVYALNNALYAYSHDNTIYFRPDRMMEADSQIRFQAGFSTDNGYYLEIDKTGSAYFYSGTDGTLAWKVLASDLEEAEGAVFFEGGFYADDKAALLTQQEVVFVDIKKKEVLYTSVFGEKGDYDNPEILVHEKYVAVKPDITQLLVYDIASGKQIYRKDFSEDGLYLSALEAFNQDGSELAVKGSQDDYEIGESSLLLLSIGTGAEEYIERPDGIVGAQDVLFLDENRIAILESRYFETYSDDLVSWVRVYDRTAKKDIWISEEYETHTAYLNAKLFSETMEKKEGDTTAEKHVLGFYINEVLVLAEEETGNYFTEVYFQDFIAGIGKYDSGRLLVGLSDGSIQIQGLEYNSVPLYAGEIDNQISSFWYNERFQITIQSLRSGTEAVVSRNYQDEEMKQIALDGKAEDFLYIRRTYDGEQKVFQAIPFENQSVIAVRGAEEKDEWTNVDIGAEFTDKSEIYLYEKDGKLILSCYGSVESSDANYSSEYVLTTTEVESGKMIYQENESQEKNLLSINISYANQSDMAASFSSGKINLFQISDGKTVLSLDANTDTGTYTYINNVWFTPDDQHLIVCMKDEENVRLRCLNIETGKWGEDLLSGVKLDLWKLEKLQMTVREDGKNILAAYGETVIWIVDIESGEVLQEIPFFAETICEYSFVNGGSHLLLYGDNQKLALWSVEEEEITAEQSVEYLMVSQMTVDSAGEYFAIQESAGMTEMGWHTGRSHIYTLNLEKEEFYPYADVLNGWACFERNEIGCLDLNGNIYVSQIRSMETLRSQGLKVLEE